jgi:hypothetical protein
MEPLKRYFENNGIPFNYNDKLNNLIDKDFKYELGKTEQLISEYKSPFIFDTTIKNNEEFKSNVVFVKKNDIYNMLITTIKPNELLSELVLGNKNDKLKFINDEIKKLDDNVGLIKKVEKIYTEKDVTPSLAKTIEEWYKIHLNRNTCVFCGNQNISNALSEWKIVIEDMYSKMKKTLISYIEDTIKICSTIISNDAFRKADSELVDFIDYIDKKLINELNNINENKFQKIIIDKTINKRDIIEINDAIDNILSYSLNQKINEITFLFNATIYLEKEKKIKMDLSDKLMEENGEIIASSINEKFKQFGLEKNILITVDRKSIPHKFAYSLKNHKGVNELSDGQKHKLALAIFMNYLEGQDLTNKTIVIDDPVVSLDIHGYILFKQYLLSSLIKCHFKDSTKLIILTHDISYLYIQLSNIFENPEMREITSIYKLSSKEIKEIPIDFIKTDDITLFRNLLDSISNLRELNIINSILIKMFRILIDLKLRFNGFSSSNAIDICKLPYDKETKTKLQKISNKICSCGRNPDASYTEIFDSLEKLYEACLILGFDNFILDSHLDKVKNIIENNIDCEEIGDLFEIVNSLKIFLENTTDDDMKNYINHTRNSYSRNIIGLGLEDFY